MLDVQRLRILRSVVSTGSVSGAAQLLGYTPSAVSQHLSALSRETGLTLVEKAGRGIAPTSAARSLAVATDDVLGALTGVQDVVDSLRTGRSGTLRLRYFASAGLAWMPHVVSVLQDEFPDVSLELRHAELATDQESAPADLDVHVLGLHPRPTVGFTSHDLLEDPYLVAVSRSHPFAGRDSVGMGELQGERWVDNDVGDAPCRAMVLDAAAAAGYRPRFAIEARDTAVALAFVALDLGITVIPRLACRQLPEGVVAVPLVDPTPVRTIAVKVREAVAGTPAARRALELLREVAAEESGNHAAYG
ncbi:LysR family transcriptional regulator [Ornithinimicrobium cavernae]|uniref:LysR family transcriptional regulator n=1 Tax=Ornithinimicrobium cavernae TaxID=2666047 RepID=UPI000D69EF26|nr:LysR family transcriptional regulator [Ornithinimicrobium cavernae]